MTLRNCRTGNKPVMDLRKQSIRGTVVVMGAHAHEARGVALGHALGRLSAAREQRGPVGVLDPFEVVPAEERLAPAESPRPKRRSGLFNFSDRARSAVDA